MQDQDYRLKYVRRLMLWSAAIISGAVIAFSIWAILSTDQMANNEERTYRTGYDAMFAAQTMQSGILRMRSQVETYLEDPTSQQSRELIAEIHRWFRQNSDGLLRSSSLLTPEEEDDLGRMLREIRYLQNEVFAAAQRDDIEQARALYSEQLGLLYDEADIAIENILSRGSNAFKDAVDRTREINNNLNLVSVVCAAGIVALSFGTSWLSSRRIVEYTSESYRKEVLFGLIARNADDVFEVYSFKDARTTYVSDNFLRIFGVSPSAYVENNALINEYIHPDDRGLLAERYFNPQQLTPHSMEFRYTNPATGKSQLFESTIYPIVGDDGSTAEYHVLLTRDITAERHQHENLEQALSEAESANRTRRDFLSRMSHELRTPINGIIGMQALAASSVGDPEKTTRYLEQISVSARQLLGLVNDVLDMAKIESGRLELEYAPFNLDAMLSDLQIIVGAQAEAKHQKLQVDVSDCSEFGLIGDERRLRQVILNFLSNAVKYSPEGGQIRLAVHQSPPEYGFTRMMVSVEDDGRGIAADELPKIFLPFERGNEVVDRTSGSGLGLPISKHVIEEMGGSLWAESEEGKGSTFSFEVSLGVAPEALEPEPTRYAGLESEKPAQQLEQEEAAARLLVVEDNLINMEIARELLTSSGFIIEEAHNGQEAVMMFEKAPPGWYSAVLMDIQMPVMDGRTAAKRIRESETEDGPRIPIYAMTADPFVCEGPGTEENFDGCIPKPIDPDLMISTLKRATKKARKGGEEPK